MDSAMRGISGHPPHLGTRGRQPTRRTGVRVSRHAHVLTPGDHYSPRTGSATATVVHGLMSAHLASGGSGVVAVARGTYEERYPVGGTVEYRLGAAPSRSRKLLDVASSRAGGRRRGAAAWYEPAIAAAAGAAPDVVFVHNGAGASSIVPARPPAVLYCHNDLLRTYTRREAEGALSSFAGVVCVSDWLADRVREAAPATADRVHRVHNGVDPAFWQRRQTTPRRRLRVLFVGRIIRDKAPHLLLDAFATIPHIEAEVRIVGSRGFDRSAPHSRYERKLRERAANLRQVVTFAPFTDRAAMPVEMHQADVLVVPSDWDEPFCLTILEGMAAGVPVIAASTGGIPEAAGGAALMVPRGDIVALAGAIEQLVDDESLRRTYAALGVRRAEQMSWGNVYPQLQGAVVGL